MVGLLVLSAYAVGATWGVGAGLIGQSRLYGAVVLGDPSRLSLMPSLGGRLTYYALATETEVESLGSSMSSEDLRWSAALQGDLTVRLPVAQQAERDYLLLLRPSMTRERLWIETDSSLDGVSASTSTESQERSAALQLGVGLVHPMPRRTALIDLTWGVCSWSNNNGEAYVYSSTSCTVPSGTSVSVTLLRRRE